MFFTFKGNQYWDKNSNCKILTDVNFYLCNKMSLATFTIIQQKIIYWIRKKMIKCLKCVKHKEKELKNEPFLN